MEHSHQPVVYGCSPSQMSVLIQSLVRVVEVGPAQVFADEDVRQDLVHLSGLIDQRLGEAVHARRGSLPPREYDR